MLAEVAAYIEAHAEQLDADGAPGGGARRLSRAATGADRGPRGAGAVAVRAPRVNDKRVDEATGERQRFSSAILAAWSRTSPQVGEVLPPL